MFRKFRKSPDSDSARFQDVVDLVKDLDRKEFNKLMKGVEKVYDGYQIVNGVQTTDEKENKDIEEVEKFLEQEEK